MRMVMTDSEILREYLTAKDKNKQIGILADLNCVKPSRIKEILRTQGIILPAPATLQKVSAAVAEDSKTEVRKEDKTDTQTKGYTAYEVAESMRFALKEEYEYIELKRKEAAALEEEARKKLAEAKKIYDLCHELSLTYRHRSVDRVLSFIRSSHITDPKEIDLLLCHCQNKLNGNIDGTEIDFSEAEMRRVNDG